MKYRPGDRRPYDNIAGDQDIPIPGGDFYWGNDPGWDPPQDIGWGRRGGRGGAASSPKRPPKDYRSLRELL